ncbi:MAG: hypothetical protein IJP23_06625 [Oscillospiraceae bacterium]|nr:hypothetical protein [Oscillospiraceae bacterium]
MGIFTEVLIAVLAAIGIATVAWLLWGLTVLPIRGCGGKRLTIILPAGRAEELSRAAEGILYLESMGIIDADLAICGDELDEEAMETAKKILRRFEGTSMIISSSEREGKSDGKSN